MDSSPPIVVLPSLTHHGYQVAKHGIVEMTRGFPFTYPKVSEIEDIKCYALCPNGTETPMVTNVLKDRNMTKKDWETALGTKLLSVEEIAEAVMKSFQYDKVIDAFITKNMFHCLIRFGVHFFIHSKLFFRMVQCMQSCMDCQ